MKKCLIIGATLLAVLTGASAGEIGHYNGGVLNIRDTFEPPEPGFYGAVYNYFYRTERLNNGSGDKISSININPGPGPGVNLGLDIDLDMYVLVPAVLWASPYKVLGAKYAAYIAPSFANTSLSASLETARGRGGSVDSSSFGVGDLYVQPLRSGCSGGSHTGI
jgi:hypothetical protein